MSKWFFGKGFIENERRELRAVAARREWNSRLIEKDHTKLQLGLIQELSGLRGLSLSFGAGCATVLAYKNREHLGFLKDLPWSEVLQLVQEYGSPEQEIVTDDGPANTPA